MSLPKGRRALYPDLLRIRDVTQLSERFRAAGSKYVADMVLNHEEDGRSQPFLVLENAVLFLRSPSTEGDNQANLVNVIVTVMMLVHEPSLINAHSSSEIINAVQRDIVVLLNKIVVCTSCGAFKAAAREITSIIILALIDDGMFNLFF